MKAQPSLPKEGKLTRRSVPDLAVKRPSPRIGHIGCTANLYLNNCCKTR